MKTLNSIIATTTIIMVAIMVLLTSFTASANVYEDRMKEAFGDIISAISFPFSDKEPQQMHNIYSNPETGVKEGQLDVYKFTIDRESIGLINNAKKVYEEVNGNDNADVYTLWINDNGEWNTQGYRIYYNPDETIVVGLACDHCYTVGFVAPDNKQHRTTYTLEWSTPDDYSDSISGRIITTYAPIKVKSVSNGSKQNSVVVINTDNLDKLMEQLQSEGMEKYQKELEMVQKKLEKTQAKLDKELSKNQDKSSSFHSSFTVSSSNSGQLVQGKVTDTDGEPIIGAMVQTIGGEKTVYTDINGEFSLYISNNVKQLKVSYVGYKNQELPVQPNMVITMEDELEQPNNLSDLFLRRTVPNENSLTEKSPTPGQPKSKDWMKKLLFYVEKVQQSGDRYLYLSKLYDLCKDTDGLDQTDLKIAAKQLESVYRQLKDKKKLKENELIFLESMVDLLHSRIKN
jgi:hypothetical protein